jgi:predicted secreted protein
MGTDQQGRNSKLAVSADGITYTDIGGTKDSISWPIAGTPIETTDRDSGGWKEFGMTGRGELSVSASANYNEDDPGQIILATAVYAQTNLYFRYRPREGAGYYEHIAYGSVTRFDTTSPDDGPIMLSFEAKLSSPTRTLQT